MSHQSSLKPWRKEAPQGGKDGCHLCAEAWRPQLRRTRSRADVPNVGRAVRKPELLVRGAELQHQPSGSPAHGRHQQHYGGQATLLQLLFGPLSSVGPLGTFVTLTEARTASCNGPSLPARRFRAGVCGQPSGQGACGSFSAVCRGHCAVVNTEQCQGIRVSMPTGSLLHDRAHRSRWQGSLLALSQTRRRCYSTLQRGGSWEVRKVLVHLESCPCGAWLLAGGK